MVESPCSFDVDYKILDNKEYGTAFSDGRVLVDGNLQVRLHNLRVRQADVNISVLASSGSGRTGPPRSRLRGILAVRFLPGMFEPGSPGKLLLTSGLATEVLDANGNVVSWKPPNKTTDACALLN